MFRVLKNVPFRTRADQRNPLLRLRHAHVHYLQHGQRGGRCSRRARVESIVKAKETEPNDARLCFGLVRAVTHGDIIPPLTIHHSLMHCFSLE